MKYVIEGLVLLVLIVLTIYNFWTKYQEGKLSRVDTPTKPTAESGNEAFPSPPVVPSMPPEIGTGNAVFQIAAQRALNFEGGYQRHQNDAGNWTGGKVGSGNLVGTNHGITATTYKAYFGKTPNKSDMKNLSQSEAMSIYKKLYWDVIKGDEIADQYTANIVLDGQLQHRFNVRLLQQSLNSIGFSLAEDNKFGKKTITALNEAIYVDVGQIYNAYKNRRIQYYYELVESDSRNQSFINGWLNRINSFDDYSNPNNQLAKKIS